jgi:CO/xanthine dehydrogenase Mo-binding subunit
MKKRRSVTARRNSTTTCRTTSPRSTRSAGGDYKKAVQAADQVISLRIANNRLIPTCMETRSILAEPNVDGTLTVYLQSQVASHASPLDRRHRRHFPNIN